MSSLSPLQRLFAAHSTSLDANNDKRERVYQTARDLIKASKRVIFILQRPLVQQHTNTTTTTTTDTSTQPTTATPSLLPTHLAQQADEALIPVYECFARLYDELATDPANPDSPDPSVLLDSFHRYNSAYSFAIQEYIEAVSFYHFITTHTLITLHHVQQHIHNHTDRPFTILPADYLLGLLDLPGEMMRFATNNHSVYPQLLGRCYAIMQQLDQLVSNLVLRPYGTYSNKLTVMRESIEKIEKLQYRQAMREEIDESVMAELVRGWGGGVERKRGLDDGSEEGGGGGGRMVDEEAGAGKRMRVDDGGDV